MQRFQSFIYWVCVTSEISHFFCCGLPVLFSILSLLSGLGLVAAMPAGVYAIHEAMHGFEVPMIITSGFIIVLGWALHYIAYRLDCRSTGCAHGPCAPKKKRSGKVLFIATALFAFNVIGYFTLHG